MRYEGITYRPPPEADNPLLQVTVGCAHNSCAFCNMYLGQKFRRISMDRIKEDIKELRGIYKRAERMFLVNGDAFVLSADYLEAISDEIHEHFPECRTISMYASIRNVQTKTDEELIQLQQKGISDLYIGIESALENVLLEFNKGFTVENARYEVGRLKKAGIRYRYSIILGAAGKGNGLENARLTADFINETTPDLVWAGTLGILKGTPLYEKMEKGLFIPETELGILEEEKALINSIKLKNLAFLGNHPTNLVPLAGMLDRDREAMTRYIDMIIKNRGAENLDFAIDRSLLVG